MLLYFKSKWNKWNWKQYQVFEKTQHNKRKKIFDRFNSILRF